jgi:dolichol-phosphate mannosyltransferase
LTVSEHADIVESFVAELGAVLRTHYTHFEIILVDDGSTDATNAQIDSVLAKQGGVRLISLSRPFGQEIAISAGLDSAIGDFVVVMLPNSDPPEIIPEMIERAQLGVGLVFGVRRDRSADPLVHRLGARLFYLVASARRLPIQRDATHFRVLSREMVNALTRIRSPKRYLRTLSHSVGYGAEAMPYQLRYRSTRARRRSFADLSHLAGDIVVTQPKWPLRAVSNIAIATSGLALLFLAYVVVVFFTKQRVAEGWTSVAGPLAFLFTVLFLVLGVLGHYLVRVLDSQADGPLYHTLGERTSAGASIGGEHRNVVTRSVDESPGGAGA